MRTLLIDNYDSYTFNLFHLLGEVGGEEPLVVRNDEAPWEDLIALGFDSVVISPGPGRPDRPRDVGVSRDALLRADVPVLGICLGHQALAHAYGGSVDHAPRPVHGLCSRVFHDGSGIFAGLPQCFRAVRYHSLAVRQVPGPLRVTATSADGVVMGLEHRSRPAWSVQFHPESVRAEHGRALVENFHRLALARTDRRRRRWAPARSPAVAPARPGAGYPAGAARRRESTPSGTRAPGAVHLHHSSLDFWCDPERVYARLYGGQEYAIWLDSARLEPGLSRFSFIGTPDGPLGQIVRYDVAAPRLIVDHSGGRADLRETVLAYCERELERLRVDVAELPFEFTCGFAGYLGYELKADCGATRAWRSPLPDAGLLFCDRLIAFDHLTGRMYLLALADSAGRREADVWLENTQRRLREVAESEFEPARLAPVSAPLLFAPRDGPEAYLGKIAYCKRQILDGESYEICLTTELRAWGRLDPLASYRALRMYNPAPYAALLRFGELSVLSSSPERFLRVGRDRVVESKPIKGTAPRSRDAAEDARLAAELGSDQKHLAENLMIADLVRNDLGRVAALGSVETPRLMAVETYATLHQLVTTVRARLRDGATSIDCIRAAFPGGSMTGAPKLRTMEIIDRLESRPRGIYSGALGFLSVNGAVDLSIVIRTLVAAAGMVSIGAGGAITALSDPEAELHEMQLKAAPLLQSIGAVLLSESTAGAAAA